jgi:hypothetical protein
LTPILISQSRHSIIAAEMTGRSCFAIDIDPAYVDVTVLRWQAFTGQEAKLYQNGQTFDGRAALIQSADTFAEHMRLSFKPCGQKAPLLRYGL